MAQENALLFLQQNSKNITSGFDIQYYEWWCMRKPQWSWACSRYQLGEFCLILSTDVVLLSVQSKMCWSKSIGSPSVVWAWGLIFKQLLHVVRWEKTSLYQNSLICGFSFVAWSGQCNTGDKAPLGFTGSRWQFRSSSWRSWKNLCWLQQVEQEWSSFALFI